MKIKVTHTDIVVDKRLSHHAISYCWIVNDYILVLKEYGELNVSQSDYQYAKIGEPYTWVTKEKKHK